MGASLAVHHHLQHDVDEYGTPEDLGGLLAELRERLQGEAGLVDLAGNLDDAATAEALIPTARDMVGHLLGQGILLNTINPGPVNTGYLDGAPASFLERFPLHRLGEPDDPARLVAWLVSDDGEWMAGQVLSSEGGFRR